MLAWRGNALTELSGAPDWWLDRAARHLSIPVEPGTKAGKRFGRVWWHRGDPYGSLLHRRQRVEVAAGLTPYVVRLAEHYGLECTVKDIREAPEEQVPWWATSAVSWRPYQDEAHRRALHEPAGILHCPPRSGKTLMAARLLDTLAVPCLYVAPSVAIVRQTYEVFVGVFGESMVSRLDGSALPEQRDLSKPIVISTAASAVKQSQDWYDSRQLLVIDEFHHAAAETYHAISLLAQNAYYRYMLTGTHFRTGSDTLAMEAICSQVVYQVGLAELVPEYLAAPRVVFVPSGAPKLGFVEDWREAYEQGVVESRQRNDTVIALAKNLALDNGIPTLILVRRRRHADALGKQIPESVVVKGGEAALTATSVREFLEGRHQVLIGTTVLGEGVDVPRAAALIYASGGLDGVTMMQSYYRPLTAAAGKPIGRIYDFSDFQHKSLRAHARKRFAAAQAQFGVANVVELK